MGARLSPVFAVKAAKLREIYFLGGSMFSAG
jgi:hypothetical protein